MNATATQLDSHRSQGHVRSNTNLIPQTQPISGLSSLQKTASALLQTMNEKNSLVNYQKSVSQMKSSLISNQKEQQLMAKSRNPAGQPCLTQMQGAAML